MSCEKNRERDVCSVDADESNGSPAQTAMRWGRVSNMLIVGCVRRREVRNGGGRWKSDVNMVLCCSNENFDIGSMT
jgi:hypothetical protein